jgi:hypothetical protein
MPCTVIYQWVCHTLGMGEVPWWPACAVCAYCVGGYVPVCVVCCACVVGVCTYVCGVVGMGGVCNRPIYAGPYMHPSI